MKLFIDTTERGRLILQLDNVILDKEVDGLSEALLVELKKFLKKQKVQLPDLTEISVNPGPGGFSSTRTGVATVNALNYALGLADQIVLPKYDKQPNITNPSTRPFLRTRSGNKKVSP